MSHPTMHATEDKRASTKEEKAKVELQLESVLAKQEALQARRWLRLAR